MWTEAKPCQSHVRVSKTAHAYHVVSLEKATNTGSRVATLYTTAYLANDSPSHGTGITAHWRPPQSLHEERHNCPSPCFKAVCTFRHRVSPRAAVCQQRVPAYTVQRVSGEQSARDEGNAFAGFSSTLCATKAKSTVAGRPGPGYGLGSGPHGKEPAAWQFLFQSTSSSLRLPSPHPNPRCSTLGSLSCTLIHRGAVIHWSLLLRMLHW